MTSQQNTHHLTRWWPFGEGHSQQHVGSKSIVESFLKSLPLLTFTHRDLRSKPLIWPGSLLSFPSPYLDRSHIWDDLLSPRTKSSHVSLMHKLYLPLNARFKVLVQILFLLQNLLKWKLAITSSSPPPVEYLSLYYSCCLILSYFFTICEHISLLH